MARNRKRAKERRARRPAPVASPRVVNEPDPPTPIEHATPDVELAEAQLAAGRPELEVEPYEEEDVNGEVAPDEIEGAELAAASLPTAIGPSLGGGPGDVDPHDARGVTVGEVATPAARAGVGSRLVNFLQGSWNELQRVQWPDRRQTLQATGVVIGFVIVAGLFLGAADYVAAKVVNYILGNH